jgi:hypothetical protein
MRAAGAKSRSSRRGRALYQRRWLRWMVAESYIQEIMDDSAGAGAPSEPVAVC